MKIMNYRAVLNRWKNSVSSPVEPETKPVVVEKKFKRKALLIGIQQIREEADPLSPDGLRSPDGKKDKKKWLKKRKARKDTVREALKGPHRDVAAMRDLLISESCLFCPGAHV